MKTMKTCDFGAWIDMLGQADRGHSFDEARRTLGIDRGHYRRLALRLATDLVLDLPKEQRAAFLLDLGRAVRNEEPS